MLQSEFVSGISPINEQSEMTTKEMQVMFKDKDNVEKSKSSSSSTSSPMSYGGPMDMNTMMAAFMQQLERIQTLEEIVAKQQKLINQSLVKAEQLTYQEEKHRQAQDVVTNVFASLIRDSSSTESGA